MSTTAQSAPAAQAAAGPTATGPLADNNKSLDGSEISKGLPDIQPQQPIVGIDYSLFQGPQGSADGSTGAGTGGVGMRRGGPVRYAGGGTVAQAAPIAGSPEEEKKKQEQGSSETYSQQTSQGNPNDYIGQWAYDIGQGNIEGLLKGPGMRALEKGDIMSAISPAAMIMKGLASGGPVRYAEGGTVAPAAGIAGIPNKNNSMSDTTQIQGGYELGPYRDWAIQVGRDVGALAAGGPVHGNHSMAGHLARQGRGRDTTLVHMSAPEVRALGKLHPSGELPINPNTGLREADFLTDVLPGIAGTLVGSVVGMPWLGAAVGGLGTWAATGNLGKGILSGLMSFGLGSIGGQLAEAGTKTAADAATKGASDVVAKAAESAASTPGGMAAGINPATFADPMAQGAAQSAGVQSAAGGVAAPAQGMFGKIGQAFNNPGQAFSNIGQGIMNPQNLDMSKMIMPGIMGASGAYGLYNANQPPAAMPNPMGQQQQTANGTPSSVPYRLPTGGTVPAGFNPATYPASAERNWFAPNPAYTGPQMSYAEGGQVYATGGGVMPDGASYQLAKGGVADLPSGMIRGPGDGTSDSIKGTIDGRRDVYLSDGEYVVNARTLAALGNGSSEAGAKKMKEFENQVIKKKLGTNKLPDLTREKGGLASLGVS